PGRRECPDPEKGRYRGEGDTKLLCHDQSREDHQAITLKGPEALRGVHVLLTGGDRGRIRPGNRPTVDISGYAAGTGLVGRAASKPRSGSNAQQEIDWIRR